MQRVKKMEIAQIILSIITAITAIVAIFMTRDEIKAQNNQCLFEKRLANYIACRKLLNLTSENLELLKFENPKDEPLEVTTAFSMITNCGFLEKGAQIIYNTNDYEIKKIFLKNIESIETMAEKSKLLFSDETGEKMKAYLISFKDALMAMYKYEVLLQLMLKNNKSTAFRKSFDELAQNYNDYKVRGEVIKSTNSLLEQCHMVTNDKILEKMYNETKICKSTIPHKTEAN